MALSFRPSVHMSVIFFVRAITQLPFRICSCKLIGICIGLDDVSHSRMIAPPFIDPEPESSCNLIGICSRSGRRVTYWYKNDCFVVVVALLFYVHDKHLRSCRDGQST